MTSERDIALEARLLGLIPDENEIFFKGDTYYLSYNSCTFDEGKQETAICFHDPWKCSILYGDHREAYKPVAEDLNACKLYWAKNRKLWGYSTDTLDEKTIVSEAA